MIILLLACLQDEAIRDAIPKLEKGTIHEAYDAVDALVRLGPSAIPALKKAGETANEPAKRRLALVVEEIEAEQTFKEFYGAPKRVSLKGDKRTLVDLLTELKTSSGEEIDFEELVEDGVNKEVTLDLKNVTFLEAFDELCKQGDLYCDRDGSSYYLYRGQYDGGPRFFFRNFMARMTTIESVRTVDFEGPPRSTLRMNFDLLWDRNVRPLAVKPDLVIDVARDDKGKDLLLPAREKTPDPEVDPEIRILDSGSSYATAPELAPLSEGATKIAELRGAFLVEFPKAFDTFAWEKATPNVAKTIGDLTITLISAKFDAQNYEYHAEFSLKSKTGKPADWLKDPLHISIKEKGGTLLDGYNCQTRLTEEEVLFTVQFTERWSSQFRFQEEEEQDSDAVDSVQILRIKEVAVKRIPFEMADIEVKK